MSIINHVYLTENAALNVYVENLPEGQLTCQFHEHADNRAITASINHNEFMKIKCHCAYGKAGDIVHVRLNDKTNKCEVLVGGEWKYTDYGGLNSMRCYNAPFEYFCEWNALVLPPMLHTAQNLMLAKYNAPVMGSGEPLKFMVALNGDAMYVFVGYRKYKVIAKHLFDVIRYKAL